MPEITDPDLLVGYDLADDAGVYRINANQALIQTVDFFTPIVDDPFTFGAIAAANALSDVYAMGGRPLTALNIVGFPHDQLDMEVLNQILLGGRSKVCEAGAVLVGGHTARDPELKYGLAVTGLVHPDQLITNAGAQPGDRLILTKKLGTGLIANAFKASQIDEGDLQEAVASMMALNAAAADQMRAFGAHACTDVTGFGLLGHAREMAVASRVSLIFHASRVPAIDLALELASRGPLEGGSRDNQLFLKDAVTVDRAVAACRVSILFDAQTSGGLLIAAPGDRAEALVSSLRENEIPAAIIGEAIDGPSGQLHVLP